MASGAAGLVLGAAAGTAAVRWGAPPDPLPRPTGLHGVGTTVTTVTRSTPGGTDRTVPVQIWYPSTPGPTGRAHLFPAGRAVARSIALHFPVPAWLLAPLLRVRGHAVADAPPAAAPVRGVVVISHGWLGFRTIHVDLAEQMASDGWVVVAPDHVGGALASQLPDGTVLSLQPALMPPTGAPDHGTRTVALVDLYADDLTAIIDAASVGMLHPLVPVVDRVVLLGQSTGGGAAVRVGGRDPRVQGIVGLDPWVEPVPSRSRRLVSGSMIAIRSGAWVDNPNDRLLRAMDDVELRAVPQAGHSDLTCLGYLSPVLRLTGLIRCDPELPHQAALTAFADLTGGS